MQFLVYIVVLLVALGGVLVELDWLTKPKLEPKLARQTASVAAPAPVARAKVDGPTVQLSPLYRAGAAPQGEQPAAASAPQAAPATTGSATVETTGSGGQAPSSQAAADQAAATNQPAASSFSTAPPQSVASFQPAVAPQPAPPPPAREAAAPAANPPEPKSTALQSNNRCDIDACAGMYQSFRASDCSYQPLEGARRACVKPGAAQRATREPREQIVEPRERNAEQARKDSKRSKEAELRAVERKVRELTSRRDVSRALARQLPDDDDIAMPGRRVIVIQRQAPRW